jgi:hypothetical protein
MHGHSALEGASVIVAVGVFAACGYPNPADLPATTDAGSSHGASDARASGGADASAHDGSQASADASMAPKLVFVTSSSFTGGFGGLTGADTKCQQYAGAGNLPGTYRAWLSTFDGTAAADRLTHAALPYQLVDGTVVAADWAELTSGTLLHPIDEDESGNTRSNAFTWTDTTVQGGFSISYDCNGWTDSTSQMMGEGGAAGDVDNGWSDGFGSTCDLTNSLYCVEQ